MTPAEAFAMTMFVLSVSSVFVLRGPLGRALAERIAGRRTEEPDGEEPEVRAIADRILGELEEVKQRLGEIEERQDFTERVLSRAREHDRLERGG